MQLTLSTTGMSGLPPVHMPDDIETAQPTRPEDLEALARAQAAAAEAEANPRPPMLTGPKRQHILPRFYQQGFARDGLRIPVELTTRSRVLTGYTHHPAHGSNVTYIVDQSRYW